MTTAGAGLACSVRCVSASTWRCHTYCQMANHYRFVVETPEGNLACGMRQLNGMCTHFIKCTYHRVGHVFQGRYKAILVEKDS